MNRLKTQLLPLLCCLPLLGCEVPATGSSDNLTPLKTSTQSLSFTGALSAWLGDGNGDDAVGTNDGTMHGVTYYADRAFSFSGTTNSYATFGSTVGNFATSNFTVILRLRTYSSRLEDVFSKRDACVHGSFVTLRINAGKLLFVLDEDTSGTNYNSLESNTVINDGAWHEIALVRNGTTVSIYVDGALDKSQSTLGITYVWNNADFMMAQSPCTGLPAGSSGFTGLMNDFVVYYKALSATELQLSSIYPQSCAELKVADPSAGDGEYTLYVGRNTLKPWTAYCQGMSGSPVEYLPLVHKSGSSNTSKFAVGGSATGTSVITDYSKLRIDPVSLQVDISDQTYSTSTGLLSYAGTAITSMPYGVAMSCATVPSQLGFANIDLGGTPFAVESTPFILQGDSSTGTTTISPDAKVVDLTGGGSCGANMPAPPISAPYNHAGGFQLPLVYAP